MQGRGTLKGPASAGKFPGQIPCRAGNSREIFVIADAGSNEINILHADSRIIAGKFFSLPGVWQGIAGGDDIVDSVVCFWYVLHIGSRAIEATCTLRAI